MKKYLIVFLVLISISSFAQKDSKMMKNPNHEKMDKKCEVISEVKNGKDITIEKCQFTNKKDNEMVMFRLFDSKDSKKHIKFGKNVLNEVITGLSDVENGTKELVEITFKKDENEGKFIIKKGENAEEIVIKKMEEEFTILKSDVGKIVEDLKKHL